MSQKKIIFAVVIPIAVLLGMYFVYEHLVYVKTDNAQIDAHTVLIGPKVGGFIQKVNVSEGQIVKKNDLLVAIDPRDYEVARDVAQSELLSLQAKMTEAEQNYKRIKGLSSKGVVSPQQYDTASAAYNEIKARYDSAKAHVQQAELNLEYTELHAPSDGIIAKKSVEIGQLAAPGIPLIGFVSSEERWVTANLKETEISHIRKDQPVTIDIDAIPGKVFKGKVESLSSATGATFSLLPPDNATGNFTKVVQRVPVKIIFDSLQPEDMIRLQAGLSAVVKIKIR